MRFRIRMRLGDRDFFSEEFISLDNVQKEAYYQKVGAGKDIPVAIQELFQDPATLTWKWEDIQEVD